MNGPLTPALLHAFGDELAKEATGVSRAALGTLVPRGMAGTLQPGRFLRPTGSVPTPHPTPRGLAPGPVTSQVAATSGSMQTSPIPAPPPVTAPRT